MGNNTSQRQSRVFPDVCRMGHSTCQRRQARASQTSGEWAIPPANDDKHESSQTSGEWTIPPANDDNHESSQTPGERAIPPPNDEIHASSQTSGKRATPPANEKIPPASKPSQPSEIRILPPTRPLKYVTRTNH